MPSPHPFAEYFNRLYEKGLEDSKTKEAELRRPRFYNLTQVFKLSLPIPGETIEIGCFKGLSSYLLCHVIREELPEFTGATHHIIDSFEGLGEPADEDEQHRNVVGIFSDTSVEHVRNTLSEFPDVSITKGWVPEVFQQVPKRTYSFIHIDVDLYEPTKFCLNFFYPQLSVGGIIVIDDFGPLQGETKYVGCAKALMEFCDEKGIRFAALTTGNAVIFKNAQE